MNDLLKEKEYIIERVLHIHFMSRHICMKYRIELDDLMQVGRIALWEAGRKFKPKNGGVSFDSYAHKLIKFRLIDYLQYLERPIRQLDYSSSIHAELNNDEETELLDVIPSEVNVDEQIMDQLYFNELLSGLTGQEKKFLKLRLDGHTFTEIEKKMRVKKKRFSIIRGNLTDKIKNHQRQLVI